MVSLPIRRLPRIVRRRPLSRRRALQGLGALVGAGSLAACGDDGKAGDDELDGESGSGTSESGDTGDSSSDSSDSSSDGATDTTTDTTTGDDPYAACETSDLTPEELLSGIDHIVVVMMENRSFDHYFGGLSLAEGLPVDGLSGSESNPNLMGDAVAIHNTTMWELTADPPHGWTASHAQFNGGLNDGFVTAYQNAGASDLDEVMGYYLREQLPVYHALLDEYVLCDRWFASVMGPTWPNRFHLHCGTSDGNQSNDPISGIPSVFDQLIAANVSCRYYASGLPFVVTYGTPLPSDHVKLLQDFFTDAENGELPSFSIIDPILTAGATIGNDDHPPADVRDGQAFIATIYDRLAASPNWGRTLFVVIYDEHGGFHDHVPPPLTSGAEYPGFEQLGFRIPALVIGGQVRNGCVNGTVFDHVSVAATIAKRWGLEPLNARVAAAADLSSCIDPDLIDNPRPPISLPRVVVPKKPILYVPGANFGGQLELAALIAKGDPSGHRRWQKQAIEAGEFLRDLQIRRNLVRTR
jgi:phospholipase C